METCIGGLQRHRPQQLRADKHGKEREVYNEKNSDISFCRLGIVLAKFVQSYQTCQRSDRRPQPADVDGNEQICVVRRKFRQQHRSGNVAYKLTARHAYKQRRLGNQLGQNVAYRVDTRKISAEYEECRKSYQQTVIDFSERLAVQCDHRNQYNGKYDIPRQNIEYDKQRQHKEQRVYNAAPNRGALFRFGIELDRIFLYKQTHAYNKRQRNNAGYRHYFKEFGSVDFVITVQIDVLRIAEWRQHTAEIGGNILHNENYRHFVPPLAAVKHNIPQRKKCDQRHIVCHNHTAEISDEYQRKYRIAQVAEFQHDFFRQPGEEADVFERRHDGKRAKERCKSGQIEISEVFSVERHEKTRQGGKKHSHYRKQILGDEFSHAQRGYMMIFCRFRTHLFLPLQIVELCNILVKRLK